MRLYEIIRKNWQLIAINAVVGLGLVVVVFVLLNWLNAPEGPSILPSQNILPLLGSRDSDLSARDELVVKIVEQAKPAVVSIVIKKDVPVIERYFEQYNPFGPFGFQIPRYREKGKEEKEIGGGSGFLISSNGLIVTNRHVVSDPDATYVVFTNDNKKYEAKVAARDPFLDIAVLKIQDSNFPSLTFGESVKLKPGQTVIAIGNSLGEFRNSVSVGVISGLSRRITAGDFSGKSELLEEVIQTDAAINPGNSGGPLLDLSGKVIGVNVAMVIGSENIGFALPADLVKGAVESVKETGEIVRPFIGIRYLPVTKSLKDKNNLPVDYGVLVVRGETPEDLAVIPGSPADKAGIVENDIILSLDGVKLDSEKSLGAIIRAKKVGDKVRLKVLHKGKEKTAEVVLEKAPAVKE